MKVYHRKNSRSVRVLWMLEEMGLDYEVHQVQGADEAFLAVNPMATLPALVDGDTVLTESMAIVEYLGLRYGPTPLIPPVADPCFPDYLEYIHYGEASLSGPLTAIIRTRFKAPEALRDNWTADNIREVYLKRLEKVAARLERRPFMAGEAFTAADISVGYAIGLGAHFNLQGSPAVLDYFKRVTARPAYQRAAGQ